MRRLFFVVLSLVLSGGLVTACGADGDGDGNDNASSKNSNSNNDNDHHGDNSPVADGAREVEVDADQLAFSPVRIEVARGEAIAIELEAGDVEHDLTVDELDLHVLAKPGGTGRGGFTADEPGEYAFYCSVQGHRESGMEGTIVVT